MAKSAEAWSGGTSSAPGTPAPRCSRSRWSLNPCCCWRTREKRENVPFLKWKMISSKYFYRLRPGFFASFSEFSSRMKHQKTMYVTVNLCYSHSKMGGYKGYFWKGELFALKHCVSHQPREHSSLHCLPPPPPPPTPSAASWGSSPAEAAPTWWWWRTDCCSVLKTCENKASPKQWSVQITWYCDVLDTMAGPWVSSSPRCPPSTRSSQPPSSCTSIR